MVLAPKIYIITNQAGSIEKQLEYLYLLNGAKDKHGIFVQIRMKNLNDSELVYFIKEVKKVLKDIKILINDRVDIMNDLELDGVHFRDKDLNFDKSAYKGKIFSKSTHSLKSIENAKQCNLDFVTYGPIYYTESKKIYGPPKGFNEIINKKNKIPLIALGGINLNNLLDVKKYFYGFAGISLFFNENIANNVNEIKKIIYDD